MAYHTLMKKTVEEQEGLFLKQAEITEILFDEEKNVRGVRTHLGTEYICRAAIIASGTYLGGVIHVGATSYESGPDQVLPAKRLTQCLKAAGMTVRRFKAGTPARVHRRSIDFDRLEIQQGDEKITPFSFSGEGEPQNKVCCYVAYTNEDTHRVIRENIHLSPIYSGRIGTVPPSRTR